MLRKVKKTVKGTSLARKIYPNHVDLGDGNIEIEVMEKSSFDFEGLQKSINTMYRLSGLAPSEMIVSPKQFKALQSIISDGKIGGIEVKESIYAPEDTVIYKK